MNLLANLSPRDRRAVTLLVPAVAAILLVRFAILPAVDAAGDSARSIEVREKTLRKYQAVAAAVPGRETSAASLSNALADAEKGLLSGAAPALQAAAVQQAVRDLANAQGIVLRSVDFVAPKEVGEYTSIGVSTGFTAGIDQVVGFLNALQASPKILGVERLRVSAANVAATAKEPAKKQVNVFVVISGVSNVNAKTKSDH